MTQTLAPARKQMGQILVARGLITQEDVERAIEEQRLNNHEKLLGEVLVDLGMVSADDVVEALAEAYGVPYAKLTPRLADAKVVELLPREFLEKHTVLPLFKVHGTLTVALSEPSNVFLIEEISRATGCQIQVAAASGADIQAILGQYVKSANVFVIDDIIEDVSTDTFELIETKVDDITNLEGMAGDSPVIKLVNYLIYTAVKEGASDIHLEPDDSTLRVRNRVDGVLYEKLTPPPQMMAPIVSRIKIMAGLDIAERRLPQDDGIHVFHRRPSSVHWSNIFCPAGSRLGIAKPAREWKGAVLPVDARKKDARLAHAETGARNEESPIYGPTVTGKSTNAFTGKPSVSTSNGSAPLYRHTSGPTCAAAGITGDPVRVSDAGGIT